MDISRIINESDGRSLMDDVVRLMCNNKIIELIKIATDMKKIASNLHDYSYWENFIAYLSELPSGDEKLILLSSIISEKDPEQSARRVLRIISELEPRQKALYFANMTRACCMKLIDQRQFFKMAKCLQWLTDEDLSYLCDNVGDRIEREDTEYIDDFRSLGLLKEVEGGFAYTNRARDFVKYVLLLGHEGVNFANAPKRANPVMPIPSDKIKDLF